MAGTSVLKTRFALSCGHDDVVGYSRISLNVMAARVAAIHALLLDCHTQSRVNAGSNIRPAIEGVDQLIVVAQEALRRALDHPAAAGVEHHPVALAVGHL